jgi:RNA polymerase sigma-70 factor (ECF subfamily)
VDFDGLFHRLYPQLFRYVHRLTGSEDAADDIAQESFVRLLGRPLAEDDARRWLFTVATNLVRDGARKTSNHQRLLALVPQGPERGPLPDEAVERRAAVESVRAALAEIPERDRTILLLRQEGLRYEEIARAVNVAPGSVGTLLARATRRFVDAYRGRERGDDAPR